MNLADPYKITLAITGTARKSKKTQRLNDTENVHVYTPAIVKASKSGAWEIYHQQLSGFLNGYYNTQYMCLTENLWSNIILKRNGEVWMSTAPMEMESMAYFTLIAKEYESIVIFGLGIGVAFCNILARYGEPNSKIKKVTIVEQDEDIYKIFTEGIAPGITWPPRSLLEIDFIIGDVFKLNSVATDLVKSRLPPDSLLYVDIWKYLGEMTTMSDMKTLCELYSPHNVMWWGQEMDFLDQHIKEDTDLDDPKKVLIFARAIKKLEKELRCKIPMYGTLKEEYARAMQVGIAAVSGAHSTIGQIGKVVNITRG